jgi:hypothetical protein
MKSSLKVARNILMKAVRPRRQVEVSFDQLIARSGLGQIFVLFYRQRRSMRSDNHEMKSSGRLPNGQRERNAGSAENGSVRGDL